MEIAGLSREASKSRIDFIDGLRGVAILAVIFYHAFVRWPDLYVYGNKFVGNPVLDTGIAGVNLFFIVSGFVILMTLRKCDGFFDFIARRWYRLFPAMFLCSVLVLLTSGLFPERPRGAIDFWDLLPGLTFVGDGAGVHYLWDPLTNLFGVHVSSIEAAFWSLYVEVRFYIIFGLAYFFLSERAGIGLVFFVWLLGQLSSFSENHLNSHFGPWDIGRHIFSATHEILSATGIEWITGFLDSAAYGFFATGALFFLFHVARNPQVFWLAVATGLLSSVSLSSVINADLVLTLLFILAMSSSLLRNVLGSKALLIVGFVSYPLYLLHENMMVAMIVKIGRAFPEMPAILIPLLPICVVFSLAWVIAEYAEPATKAFLDVRSKTNRRQSYPVA
jgi:peptidoglycan/LPS O-acetylase OafA/YrhL